MRTQHEQLQRQHESDNIKKKKKKKTLDEVTLLFKLDL